jgi:hypothetical protein
MHGRTSMSHVRRDRNRHSAATPRHQQGMLYRTLGHRIRLCSRYRPQRGLHDALGPLGRAFLMPHPVGVVHSLKCKNPTVQLHQFHSYQISHLPVKENWAKRT